MRKAQITALIGQRGTGKSTFANEILTSYMSTNTVETPRKALILDTIDHEAYSHIKRIIPDELPYLQSGIVRMYGSDIEGMLNTVGAKYYNGLLIIEDSRKFIGWRLTDNLRNILIDTKQKGVDVLLMFHGFHNFVSEISLFIDNITTFKTRDDLATVKKKIPNPEVWKAWEKVQASKNPYERKTIKLQ